jgi:hypothetical protein
LHWSPPCAGPAGDEGCGCAGPDPVVDVHNRQAGRAGLEHRQERGLAFAAGTVTGRHREPDHRRVDQARDHPGQHPVHTGRDDQDVGAPLDDLAQRLEQPMEAGHADVEDDAGLHTGGLEDHPSLLRHREVGGAGGEDRGPAAGRLRPMLGAHPAGDALALLASKSEHKSGRRVGGLAGSQDDLRDAPPGNPAEVDPGMARQLQELRPADLLERLVDGQLTSPEPRQHPPHFGIIYEVR